MIGIYDELVKNLGSGDIKNLPEVHATSSGLKAISTIFAANGMEECRKACGGHGFSSFSGIGELFTTYVSNNTLEGENYMIIQQTTRFLIKSLREVQSGKKLVGNISYLNDLEDRVLAIGSPNDLRSPKTLLKLYSMRATQTITHLLQEIEKQVLNGKTVEWATQHLQWISTKAARDHCMYTIVWCFSNAIEKQKGKKIYAPLSRLRDLFALYNIELEMGDYLEEIITKENAHWIRSEVRNLLSELRTDAVSLVDAFGYHDYELKSALGRYDGKVYSTLYEWAQKEPLNQGEVVPGYEELIKPILKGQFSKL